MAKKRRPNWKNIKKVGAVALSAVTIFSTLSFGGSSVFNGGGKVFAAEDVKPVPAIQDSSSAVNYATILGRATDFGIVVEEFHHENHMETTIAVNHYNQMGANVTDVDFVSGTAQFIVSAVDSGYFALGSAQKAITYNVEVGKTTYEAVNPEAETADVFSYPIQIRNSNPPQYNGKGRAGKFWIDYDFASDAGKTLNMYPVADSTATNNVNLIIKNMQERSAEINDKANDEAYVLDYTQYTTDDGAKMLLDVDRPEFANKVIYINVDSLMADRIAAGKLNIYKDDSTIICFNYPKNNEDVVIGRLYVSVDQGGKTISSVTGSSGNTEAEGHTNDEVDVHINQKLVFNIQTKGNVYLDASGGTFLVPEKTSHTEVVGSSTGWIVSAGSMTNHAEWHYIYKAVSQESMTDKTGEIHFASRKAITHEWNGKQTKEDKTVFTPADTYTFNFYETDADYNVATGTLLGTKKNQATNTVKFPTVKFYSDSAEAAANNASDYYVPEGKENFKIFYFVINEDGAGTKKDGVEISSGHIDIQVVVTNENGIFRYQVSSKTYLGDDANTLFKENKNVSMSGVEFGLGAFYNKTDSSLKLKKSVYGDCAAAYTDSYTFYVQDASGNYYDKDSVNKGTTKTGISIKDGEEITLEKLPYGKYTVSEDTEGARKAGYANDLANPKTVEVSATATPVANMINQYYDTTLTVKKTATGDVPSSLSNADYSFYIIAEDYPNMYLDENGVLTSEKKLITVKAGDENAKVIHPEVIGKFKVVEDTTSIDNAIAGTMTVLDVSYNNQETEISVDNKNVETEIVNKYTDVSEIALIIEKKIDGVSYNSWQAPKVQVKVHYYSDYYGTDIYVDAEGRNQMNGNVPRTKDAASAITVTAGQPLVIKARTQNNWWTHQTEYAADNGIWGSEYDSNGTKYIIEEVSYPDTIQTSDSKTAYYKATTYDVKEVTLHDDKDKRQQTLELTNTYKTIDYSLTIKKTVNDSKLDGQLCEFIVMGPNGYYINTDGSQHWSSATTSLDQVPKFQLYPGESLTIKGDAINEGTYTVTEVTPTLDDVIIGKDGKYYVLNSVEGNGKDVTLSTTNPDGSATIKNNYIEARGSLKITKELTAAGAPDGADTRDYKFNITGPNGYTKSITLKAGEETTIPNLELGEYVVTEDEADATIPNYTLTVTGDNATPITVKNTSTKEVKITNTYSDFTEDRGSLKITKQIAAGAPAEAATKDYIFRISGPEFSEPKTVTITGAGSVTLDNLKTGTYKVQEVTASAEIEGYELDVIGEGDAEVVKGALEEKTVTNAYTEVKGSLIVAKVVADSAPYAAKNKEYTFHITGIGFSKDITVKANQRVKVDNLTLGTYTITEDQVSANVPGYTLDVTGDNGSSYTLVDETPAIAIITNNYSSSTPGMGQLTFTKTIGGGVTETEANGDDLYFVIQNTDTNEYLKKDGSFTTNANDADTHITLADLTHTIDAATGKEVWSKTYTVPTGNYTVNEVNHGTIDAATGAPYVLDTTRSAETDSTTVATTPSQNADGTLNLVNEYSKESGELTFTKTIGGGVTETEAAGDDLYFVIKNTDTNEYLKKDGSFTDNANDADTHITLADLTHTTDAATGKEVWSKTYTVPTGNYTVNEVNHGTIDAATGAPYVLDTTRSAETDSTTVATTPSQNADGTLNLVNEYSKESGELTFTKTIGGGVTETEAAGDDLYFVIKNTDTNEYLKKDGSFTDNANDADTHITLADLTHTTDAATGKEVWSKTYTVPTGNYTVNEVNHGTIDAATGAPYVLDTTRSTETDSTTVATTPSQNADGTLNLVNEYSKESGELTFTKTIGGGVTETEAAGDDLYFVIKNTDTNEYLKKDGSFTDNANDADTHITLADLTHTTDAATGKEVWSKTYTVPTGNYTVNEVNHGTIDAATGAPYVLDTTRSAETDSTTVATTPSQNADGTLNLVNEYSKESGELTFTKTIGGGVTETEAAGDDLYFVIKNTDTNEYLKKDGSFTDNANDADTHITLADLTHTTDAATGKEVWSKTYTVPTGNYTVNEVNHGTIDAATGAPYVLDTTRSTETDSTTVATTPSQNADGTLNLVNEYSKESGELTFTKTIGGGVTETEAAGDDLYFVIQNTDTNQYLKKDGSFTTNANDADTHITLADLTHTTDAATGKEVWSKTYTVPTGNYTVNEVNHGTIDATTGAPYVLDTTRSTETDSTTVATTPSQTADGTIDLVNEYTRESGSLIFTKTIGGGVTEAEAAGDDLYFVIQNTDTNQYLKKDGSFTDNANDADTHITLADLDHEDDTTVWRKTYTVPTGNYTVNEVNHGTIDATTGAPYVLDQTSTFDTSNTSVSTTTAGRLNLVNEYNRESGQLTFTKTIGGGVTETEAAGDDLYFVIKNTDTNEYLKKDGSFTTNANDADTHITLADLTHTTDASGKEVWSKTYTVPTGNYTVNEVNHGTIDAATGAPYVLDTTRSAETDSTTVATTPSQNADGTLNLVNEYSKESGQLTFTKTIGGGVTETEAAGDDLYFVIKNTDTNEYLKKDGSFTDNANDADTHITLADLTHTTDAATGKEVWSKTYTVPTGNYTVNEVNHGTIDAATGAPYVLDTTRSTETDSTTVATTPSQNADGTLNLVNEYSKESGELTFTKTIGGGVTETEAAGDDLYFVIQNTDTNQYLKKDGSFTTNANDADTHITLADLTHTTDAATGKEVWSKTYTVPTGNYTVNEVNHGTIDATTGAPYVLDTTRSTETDSTTVATTPSQTADGTLNLVNEYVKVTETAELIIEKTIGGEVTDAEAKGALQFTVTTTVGNDTMYLKADGTLSDSEVILTLNDGFVKSTNANNEAVWTKTFDSVPAGQKYTVTEKNYEIKDASGAPLYNFVSSTSKTSATTAQALTKDGSETLQLRDDYEKSANLKLLKTVAGKSSANNFTFYVKGADNMWYDADGNASNTQVEVIVPAGSNGVTISGLPLQTYTITEADATNLASTGYEWDADNADVTAKDVILSTNGETKTATMTNAYKQTQVTPDTANLKLLKTVTGQSSATEFTFYVQGADNKWYKADGTTSDTKVGVTVPAGSNGVTISGLPLQTYTITEADATGLAETGYEWDADNADVTDKVVTLSTKDETKTASMTNAYKQTPVTPDTANLKLLKTVTGQSSATEFTFYVQGADNKWYKADGTTSDTKVGVTVPAGSNGVTISGLPLQTYTITEADATGLAETGYEWDADNADVTDKVVTLSTKDETKTASMTNAYKQTPVTPDTANLKLLKTVTGQSSATEFTFYVQGADNKWYKADGTTSDTKVGVTVPAGSNGVTISGLPLQTYTITEADATGLAETGYEWDADNADVTDKVVTLSTKDETKTASMTNAYKQTPVTPDTANLKLLKTVTGQSSATEFTFYVQGADNKWYKADGTTSDTKVGVTVPAGSNGVTISGLPLQTYTITEADATGLAETGYEWDADNADVTDKVVTLSTKDETKTASMTNAYKQTPVTPDTANLKLLKTVTGQSSATEFTFYVQGADNKWYKADGTTSDTKVGVTVPAGSNGVTISGLPLQTYTITEADATGLAETGYEWDADNADVTDKVVTLSTKDETKTASMTNAYKQTPVTPDTANLKLLKTITGQSSATEFTFYVQGADNKWYKADGTTSDTKVGVTVPAGSNGVTISGLPLQTYTITEADATGLAETGYEWDADNADVTDKVVTLSTKDETKTASMTNAYKQINGKLIVTKSVIGAPAKEANKTFTFEVTGTNYTSGEFTLMNGESKTLENLKLGTYTVTEKETGENGDAQIDGYTLTVTGNGVISKTLTDATAQTVTITNTYNVKTQSATGKLTISKSVAGDLSANDDAVKGKTFTFKVTGPNNYEHTVSFTGAGNQTLTGLETGEYTITEQGTETDGAAQIEGYTLTVSDSGVASVTLTDTENEKSATITNTYTKNATPTAKLTIKKQVSGAVAPATQEFTFVIKHSTKGYVKEIDTTNSVVTYVASVDEAKKYTVKDGESVEVTGLEKAKYTVEELETGRDIAGYEFDAANSNVKPDVDLTNGDSDATLENAYKTIIKISKVEVFGQGGIAGATLQIIRKSDSFVMYQWISDTKVLTFAIPNGEYLIREINAPTGYIKSTVDVEFKVENGTVSNVSGKDGQLNANGEIEFKNDPIKVTISKVDTSSLAKVGGAKMEISRADGTPVDVWKGENKVEWISNGSAAQEFKNLPEGNYILKELEAPTNYEKDTTVVYFTVNADGTVTITQGASAVDADGSTINFKNAKVTAGGGGSTGGGGSNPSNPPTPPSSTPTPTGGSTPPGTTVPPGSTNPPGTFTSSRTGESNVPVAVFGGSMGLLAMAAALYVLLTKRKKNEER